MTSKRIVSILLSALIGFGLGLGLLFQLPLRAVWFAANAPGAWLLSPFVGLGASVWLVPFGNAVAYAAMAALFICASGLAHGIRKRASI
jgi:hypothetical protein